MTITHQAVGLSYNADDFRFGSTDKLNYFFERRRNQVLLDGCTRLFRLQTSYAKSYVELPSLTVLGYRDMLLSLALSLCLRCCQTRDVLYTEMTTHSSRYWGLHGNNFWSALPTYEDDPTYVPGTGFFGLAGSLAFWMYKNQDSGDGLYPQQLVKRMLCYFWNELFIPGYAPTPENSTFDLWYRAVADEKLEELIVELGIKHNPIRVYQSILLFLLSTPIDNLSSTLRAFVYECRRKLLTVNDADLLPQRILLGEYSDTLMTQLISLEQLLVSNPAVLTELRTYLPIDSVDILQSTTDLTTINSSVLNLAKPGGLPLVLLAFSVQSLLEVIDLITNKESLHSVLLSDFINQSEHSPDRSLIAEHFATGYDAFAALGLFNTIYESRGLSYRMYLSAVQMIAADKTSISKSGDTRLNKFIAL